MKTMPVMPQWFESLDEEFEIKLILGLEFSLSNKVFKRTNFIKFRVQIPTPAKKKSFAQKKRGN